MPLQPKSQHSSTPSSKPSRRRASHRPDRYQAEHRPRRVIASRAPSEYSFVAPQERLRAPRASLLKKLRSVRLTKTRIRFGPWELLGLGASIVACALLLGEIAGAQRDHQRLRVALGEKETQFASIEKQRREDEKKLAYLRSEKGREQILASRGYLKPGDRILLFSDEKKKPDGQSSTP